MKSITLGRWNPAEDLTMKEKEIYLSKNGTFEYIDMLNWPADYPYKPQVKFKLLSSDRSLFIQFQVQEENIRAIYGKDQDPVWQDSCVEFFCQFPGQAGYYNFEFNCIGTCLASKRKSRNEDIVSVPKALMQKINRLSSLGTKTFDEKSGNFEWTLTVEIPAEVFGLSDFDEIDVMKANFYKCGDETRVPHYLSWNLIVSPTPNFHLPEYFGEVKFK